MGTSYQAKEPLDPDAWRVTEPEQYRIPPVTASGGLSFPPGLHA